MLVITSILRMPEHSRTAQLRYATACRCLLGVPTRSWSESDGGIVLVFCDTLLLKISAVCGMRRDRLEIDAQFVDTTAMRDRHVVETRWLSTRHLTTVLKEWGWAFYFDHQLALLSSSDSVSQ